MHATAATKGKRAPKARGKDANDRFHGSKAANDNAMAAAMAKW